MATANDELVDRGIRHAVHLARLQRQTSNDVLALLNDDVLPDLVDKLRRRLERFKVRGFDTGPWTTKRLRDVIKTTRAQIAAGMDLAGEQLVVALKDIGVTEAQWQAARLTGALPTLPGVDLAAIVPSARHIGTIITSRPFEGDLMKGWWSKLKRKAQDDIGRQIQIGVTEGETNAAIIRRLAGTSGGRYMDGAFGGLRRNVAATVQTSASHMNNQAREMTYEANDDIVKGVQFVATLDPKTCEICMSLDGKVFPIGEGPRPPMHWNCLRCTTVPVLKSLREIGYKTPKGTSLPPGTRADMSGQVPARQTYGAWLRKQPAAVQDDVLGKTKGALYRKHKLSVGSFVDDKRRVLTLEQLRRREGLDPVPKVIAPAAPTPVPPPSPPKYRLTESLEEAVAQAEDMLPGTKIGFQFRRTDIPLQSKINQQMLQNAINASSRRVADTRARYTGFNEWAAKQDSVKTFYVSTERYVVLQGDACNGYYSSAAKQVTIGLGQTSSGPLSLGRGSFLVSSNQFDGTFMHELGHAYHNSITGTPLENRWLDIWYGPGIKPDRVRWWKRNVSGYAGTNAREAFAESFEAFTHTNYGKGRRHLPQPVEDFFKDLMGG